jgi:hypothetical protein
VPSAAPGDPQTVVFIGTAVETEAYAQNALVHVEEVWYGGPLGEWQAVLGVEAADQIMSGITRLEIGRRYAVVATRQGSRLLSDCSTTLYTAKLAQRRPDDVSAPTPSMRPLVWGTPSFVLPLWWLVSLAAVVVVVIGAFRPSRRGEPANSPSPVIR